LIIRVLWSRPAQAMVKLYYERSEQVRTLHAPLSSNYYKNKGSKILIYELLDS